SIMYHPCEFVHKEFWDGVNFRKGANPPREDWKLPPTKSPEESKVAFDVFEKYVEFLQRFPDVRFLTARQAAEVYRDRNRGRTFSAKELAAIAAAVSPAVSFQERDGDALAAGEVFALLNAAVALRKPEAVALEDMP